VSMHDDDFVRDIIKRIRAEYPDIDDATAEKIECDIRHDWGGERPYISRENHIREKKRKKVRDAIKGSGDDVRMSAIASSTGVHRSTIYRMLKREKKK